MAVDKKLTKASGEHWVCSMLARHCWAPALTRDGLERTDILAVAACVETRPTVEIQVKTATQMAGVTSWFLGAKGLLHSRSHHEWYVFVMLPMPPSAPRGFVVPRDHVSASTWIVHQNWRTDPSAPAGKRNTDVSQARVNSTVWEGYENRWDLLERPTSEVPVLLPAWLRPMAVDPRVSLPPGHPWMVRLPDW